MKCCHQQYEVFSTNFSVSSCISSFYLCTDTGLSVLYESVSCDLCTIGRVWLITNAEHDISFCVTEL